MNAQPAINAHIDIFDSSRRRAFSFGGGIALLAGFILLVSSLLITVAEHVEQRSFHMSWIYGAVFVLFGIGAHFLDRAAEER